MSKLLLREDQYLDASDQFVYEDMQVMSDFELHKLCTDFKTLEPFKLPKESYMESSGKVQMLLELLKKFRQDGDRVLLFSQFVIMLDILELILETAGYKFIRLDGQTQLQTRQDLIDSYQSDDSITVFLLSTKAGGFGINLTSANVVILYDIDFNPHNDAQVLLHHFLISG